MENILKLVEAICELLGALSVLATIIVRLTPSKKDDEEVGKVTDFIYKALHFLPTLGVNPQTKALNAAYEDLKAKLPPK